MVIKNFPLILIVRKISGVIMLFAFLVLAFCFSMLPTEGREYKKGDAVTTTTSPNDSLNNRKALRVGKVLLLSNE